MELLYVIQSTANFSMSEYFYSFYFNELCLIIRHNPIQKLELENYEPTISFLWRDS